MAFVTPEPTAAAAPGPSARLGAVLGQLFRRPLALVGLIVIAVIVIAAIFAPFIAPFDPAAHPGRKAIAAESRRRIEKALVASLRHPLRDFAHAVEQIRYTPAPKEEV